MQDSFIAIALQSRNPCAELSLTRFAVGICTHTRNDIIAIINERGLPLTLSVIDVMRQT